MRFRAGALSIVKTCARVGAVIVTYHPNLPDLSRTVAALSPQVESVFVVDNGSGPETMEQLRLAVADSNAELLSFQDNRGIAAAQNAAISMARSRGFDFLVLFDQDSLPAADLVVRLCGAHSELARRGMRVAAVGPQWMDERTGRLGSFYRVRRGRIVGVLPPDAEPVEVDFLIASGTLLTLQAVAEIGPMREDWFIDHVDTEWCVRASRAGWKLYGTSGARLTHALGDEGRRVWLGRWREVAVHSPLRNYYEVRNTVLLLRTPGLGSSWRVAQLTRLAYLLAFYALLAPPRLQRIGLMLRALTDGVRGRAGKLA